MACLSSKKCRECPRQSKKCREYEVRSMGAEASTPDLVLMLYNLAAEILARVEFESVSKLRFIEAPSEVSLYV